VTPPLDDHLMPIHFEPRYMTWNANRVVSFGANGDSFYEYLLKASVQVREEHAVDIFSVEFRKKQW
jgi:hypothetical protein